MGRPASFLLAVFLTLALFALPNVKAERGYWAETYGGESYDTPWGVAVAPNGDIIAAGYTEKLGTNGDVWVLRFDENGTVKWQKTYGGSEWDEAIATGVAPNGDAIVAGYTASFGVEVYRAWLLRLDPDGNVRWQRMYGNEYTHIASAVAVAPDGDIVIAGYTNAPTHGGPGDVWVARLDPDGNVRWQITYGRKYEEDASAVAIAPNGDAVVVGLVETDTSDHDLLVLRLDPEGNLRWAKTYGGDDIDEGLSITTTHDDEILVGGVTESFREGGLDEALVLKLDGNGSVEWAKTFGKVSDGLNNEADSIAPTKEGDILVAGNYLFLLSPDGKLKWAGTGYWNFAYDESVDGVNTGMAPDGTVALVGIGLEGDSLLVARFDVGDVPGYSTKEGWRSVKLEVSDVDPEVRDYPGRVMKGAVKVRETGCVVHDTGVKLKLIWQSSGTSTGSQTGGETTGSQTGGVTSTEPPTGETPSEGSGICGPGFIGLIAVAPLILRRMRRDP
ncbi:hypothetical protein A3L12_02650 [Thermococcus sp. P6]|uniref:hypothetical protein n=1 Tax=Thermococcus sp. P6 TaxID=122420 RepID=UPI000B5DCFC1|nr:hypothetical protein [Thermococcus sp. P6]ASJ10269.1 hypothetical protein A3L12_02650 [Thermococcus sp. P6]